MRGPGSPQTPGQGGTKSKAQALPECRPHSPRSAMVIPPLDLFPNKLGKITGCQLSRVQKLVTIFGLCLL